MKKYYYATELDPEHYDWENYLDEGMLIEDGIAICGNREFCGMNTGLVKDIEVELQDCKYDVDVAREDDSLTIDEQLEEAKKTVEHYFGSKRALTEDETIRLIRLCDLFATCKAGIEELEIICEALSIKFGVKYDYTDIRGCCQGDWNTLYYPEGTSREYIKLIEAEYFATGTELYITDEKVSEEEVEDADGYCDYTYLYNKNDIKKWLAENIGCTEDEVKIRIIKNTYTTKHYEYEEN